MPTARTLIRLSFAALALGAVWAVLLAGPGLPGPASATGAFAEYQVKAEFLGRIAQFVEWPADAFSGPADPFVIALAGGDPFGEYLEEVARRGAVGGRRVTLRRLPPGGQPGRCHLLFIPSGEYARLPELLALTAGRPVLTVGDGEKFARQGADIGLYREAGRVRFSVNLGPSRRSRLVISSKLLRLAAAVYGGEPQ